MMLATIEFDYNADARVHALPTEQYQAMRQRLPQLQMPEVQTEFRYYSATKAVVDEEELEYLTDLNLPVLVTKVKGLQYGPGQVDNIQPGVTVTNISVPNASLFAVTKVFLLDNACTDELQRHLDSGWRILAVCPPNDQRRPDYILGKAE